MFSKIIVIVSLAARRIAVSFKNGRKFVLIMKLGQFFSYYAFKQYSENLYPLCSVT